MVIKVLTLGGMIKGSVLIVALVLMVGFIGLGGSVCV